MGSEMCIRDRVGLFVGPVVMVALLLIWQQWMNPGVADGG